MSDPKHDDDDPIANLKRGVALLARAARNAAQAAKDTVHAENVDKVLKAGLDEVHRTMDRLQEDKIDGAIKTSLQEIGRALGNVAQKLDAMASGSPGPKDVEGDPKKDPKKDEEKKKD